MTSQQINDLVQAFHRAEEEVARFTANNRQLESSHVEGTNVPIGDLIMAIKTLIYQAEEELRDQQLHRLKRRIGGDKVWQSYKHAFSKKRSA
jgi:hypothetical protein